MAALPTTGPIDDDEDPPPPPGVTLYDPDDSEAMRGAIEGSVANAFQRYVSGHTYGGVRLEVSNLKFVDKDRYTLAEQKEALLKDRQLSRRLRGDVKLYDVNTNEVLDTKKNLTLAKVPWLSQRGTFISNGSEFAPVSQSRLLPGVYTRKRANGELETMINARPGTGSSMRLTLDPASAQYRLKVGSSDLHAYSVFKDLGVSDDELERRWGPEVLEMNRSSYSRNTLDRLYKKAIPKWRRDDTLDTEAKAEAIREALNQVQVSKGIMQRNLPNLYSQEKAASWRQQGRAVEVAHSMVKAASIEFSPDLAPGDVADEWLSFEDEDLFKQASASFDPDLSPDEMHETYQGMLGKALPNLAAARSLPEHWKEHKGKEGWLSWYEQYHEGKRGPNDEEQIERWKSFKRMHGAKFALDPTPRRAFSLLNWGIDPLQLLPSNKRQSMRRKMEKYRKQEYVKWYLNRHDFDAGDVAQLVAKANRRGAGADPTKTGPGELMTLALRGYIQVEDLKY